MYRLMIYLGTIPVSPQSVQRMLQMLLLYTKLAVLG